MADNYQITEGVGKSMRSREVSSVHRAVFFSEPYSEGGYSKYRNIDLGVTGQVVKASAGQIYGMHFFNAHSTDIAYVKLYNKATAADENDTPVHTYPLGPKGGFCLPLPHGEAYDTGISVRATTGIADNSTGAPSSNQVIVNLQYF